MSKIFTGNGLKTIAVVSMTVDHVGAVLFPQEIWMRYIGRLAFVLYAFLITEGYVHTHNVKKYMLRLGLLAVLSEVPFDLLFHGRPFYPYAQNVFFTLLLGLLGIYFMDRFGVYLNAGTNILALVPVGAACFVAGWLLSDYKYYGVLMIAVFYVCRGQPWAMSLGIGSIALAMNRIQLFCVAALLPIALYNGQKGRGGKVFQWFFYFYYPMHMLAIYGICEVLRFYAG